VTTYANILVETHGRVGLVRLNRPQALNALNSQVMSEVTSAATELDHDPGIGAEVQHPQHVAIRNRRYQEFLWTVARRVAAKHGVARARDGSALAFARALVGSAVGGIGGGPAAQIAGPAAAHSILVGTLSGHVLNCHIPERGCACAPEFRKRKTCGILSGPVARRGIFWPGVPLCLWALRQMR